MCFSQCGQKFCPETNNLIKSVYPFNRCNLKKTECYVAYFMLKNIYLKYYIIIINNETVFCQELEEKIIRKNGLFMLFLLK